MGKLITDLNSQDAQSYFLKNTSYTNIILPEYFNFSDLLSQTSALISDQGLPIRELRAASDSENVNHILYDNKNGKYAWRKYQLIHPAIYVSLIKIITFEENWKFICQRLESLQKNTNIKCVSLPYVDEDHGSRRTANIERWIDEIESKSLEFSFQYKFLFHADISNCYSSIYTHSITWALHGKEVGKAERRNNSLLGNKIDLHLQSMSYCQTNGIPEGSIVMDFIAEILLLFIDSKLNERLVELIPSGDYQILRYRDDYRIFVNDLSVGDLILKNLTEVLIDHGLRLNDTKTSISSDIIQGALKADKYYSLEYESVPDGLTKHSLIRHLLIIKKFGMVHPNSGILVTRLNKILHVVNRSNFKNQEVLVTAILTEIAFLNPRTFPSVAAIIRLFFPSLDRSTQKLLVQNIHSKMCNLPNSGLIEIWLQRIALGVSHGIQFNESLCRLCDTGLYNNMFESDWIQNDRLKTLFTQKAIEEEFEDMFDFEIPEEYVESYEYRF